MASGAAVPFWRSAGMTYITYSNMVRNCLKEPLKTESIAREKVHFSLSKWADAKPPSKPSFGVSKDGQCLHSRVYGTDICCTPQTLGSKLGPIRNLHSSSQNEFEAGRNNFVGRENPRKWPDPSSDPAHSGSFSTRFSPLENPRNNRPMNAVMGIMQGDRKDMMGFSPRVYNIENNADIVHIKVMRNNSFVTVTDSKGNKKIGASSGSLSEMKGGSKGSRYSAEAAAEHIGRTAKNMGIKSVVMKVNGFTYFKKKKQAILSFRDGYTNSRTDQNPIVHIEDTTRKPHNGCRLRKKTRK